MGLSLREIDIRIGEALDYDPGDKRRRLFELSGNPRGGWTGLVWNGLASSPSTPPGHFARLLPSAKADKEG